jgi:hypothetical protein
MRPRLGRAESRPRADRRFWRGSARWRGCPGFGRGFVLYAPLTIRTLLGTSKVRLKQSGSLGGGDRPGGSRHDSDDSALCRRAGHC